MTPQHLPAPPPDRRLALPPDAAAGAGRVRRRTLLLGGGALACLLPAVGAALASPHHPHPAAHDATDEEGAGTGPAKALSGAGTGTGAASTPLGPMDTVAQWAFITDFTTGATLLDKQADLQVPPSSMTKLMTAYIVYGKLQAGQLKLDQSLPVSEKAWRMQGSKMFVPLNGQVVVEELIRGMIIQSGNDACIVLAEGVAGSEEQFVSLMNAKAKELGLTNSQFQNCTGWPAANHYMSVRDIATLAQSLIRAYPEYYHYDAEKDYKYNGIEQYNRNPLVQRGMADGLKTGHTEAGGFGIVASSLRNNRRVVMVLNGMPTQKSRIEESERLIQWAFNSFENVSLFAAGDTVENAPVWLGTRRSVPLVGGKDLVVTMPRSWRDHAQISVAYDSPIQAPVGKGAVVARLVLAGQGVPQMEVPLLAGADVPRLGIPGRAMAVVSRVFGG